MFCVCRCTTTIVLSCIRDMAAATSPVKSMDFEASLKPLCFCGFEAHIPVKPTLVQTTILNSCGVSNILRIMSFDFPSQIDIFKSSFAGSLLQETFCFHKCTQIIVLPCICDLCIPWFLINNNVFSNTDYQDHCVSVAPRNIFSDFLSKLDISKYRIVETAFKTDVFVFARTTNIIRNMLVSTSLVEPMVLKQTFP